jgi:(p)ppGpp synthase/HD superfamily hydrolase
MTHWLDKVVKILNASTGDLRELAQLAGYDPKTFYAGTVMDGVDVCGQDLSGMNLKLDFSNIKYDERTIFTGPRDLSASTKLQQLHDKAFCFTPKGRLIALPRGATAIDFAYAVHTVIGNSAVGCKINGRIAPLITVLQNGDEVQISRSDRSTPPAAWDSVVVTRRARSAIRRATREAAWQQFGGLGRMIVERSFEKAGKKFSESKLKAALPRLARSSIDDVMVGVGRGEIYSSDVVRAVHPDFRGERRAGPGAPPNETGWFELPKAANLVFRVPGKSDPAPVFPMSGLDLDTVVRFAPNGGALPGERIVGIRGPDGVTIYPIHSPALAAFNNEPERWLDVRWDSEAAKSAHSTEILITMRNEPGALGVIARIIGEYGADIDAVSSTARGANFRDLRIDLQVRDIQHLNAILAELRGKEVVLTVERLSGVFVGVGRAEISSTEVLRATHSELKEERKARPDAPPNEAGWFQLPKAANLVFRVHGKSDPAAVLPVSGLDPDTVVRFAPKGGALPGERIVGIRGSEGITIYPIHSPALAEFNDEPDRWLDVRWDLRNNEGAVYSTQIYISTLNEPGTLGVIATTIGECGAMITDVISSAARAADFQNLRVDLQVPDIEHLNAILADLRGKDVVLMVERLSG